MQEYLRWAAIPYSLFVMLALTPVMRLVWYSSGLTRPFSVVLEENQLQNNMIVYGLLIFFGLLRIAEFFTIAAMTIEDIETSQPIAYAVLVISPIPICIQYFVLTFVIAWWARIVIIAGRLTAGADVMRRIRWLLVGANAILVASIIAFNVAISSVATVSEANDLSQINYIVSASLFFITALCSLVFGYKMWATLRRLVDMSAAPETDINGNAIFRLSERMAIYAGTLFVGWVGYGVSCVGVAEDYSKFEEHIATWNIALISWELCLSVVVVLMFWGRLWDAPAVFMKRGVLLASSNNTAMDDISDSAA